MNIKLMDQALTTVLTGLMYGSEVWFACALSLYVVKRSTADASRRHLALKLSDAELSDAELSDKAFAPTAKDLPHLRPGTIQIDIVPLAEKPVKQPVKQPVEKNNTEAIAPKQNLLNLPPAVTASPKAIEPEQISASPHASSQQISCEPVNWQKWKVSDLRKASIAKVCGVRIRPVGSSRNLPKADLIAQYKQNLKRFTQSPPKKTIRQGKTA